MLASCGGLRQELVGRGCGGIRGDLSDGRGASRRRALAIWTGCPRLVLLCGTRGGESCEEDGDLPAHADHVLPSPAQHGLLRPSLSEPGYPPAWRLRQPDRAPAPAW